MWIHRILIILLLSIASVLIIESHQGQIATTTPTPASISSATISSGQSTTPVNASDNKWMCPLDELSVMIPETTCFDDVVCIPGNSTVKSIRDFCYGPTSYCCQEFPMFNLSEPCSSTGFPLEYMEKCSGFEASDNSSGICPSSPTHVCQIGRCCPRIITSGTTLVWPKTLFKTNISCDWATTNTSEMPAGQYCSPEEKFQYIGNKSEDLEKKDEDWLVVVVEKATKCDTGRECASGMSCVSYDQSGGKCIFLLPPVPKTTTTTTTKKPTTTTIPEEATTFDPYNSWGAYLARGWERNKLLFYFSCLFCYCGILGTCFFWLKKKFFIWIMRPDPYEDTPSMRSMQRAFDIVEERERNRRRRKKFRFFSFGR